MAVGRQGSLDDCCQTVQHANSGVILDEKGSRRERDQYHTTDTMNCDLKCRPGAASRSSMLIDLQHSACNLHQNAGKAYQSAPPKLTAAAHGFLRCRVTVLHKQRDSIRHLRNIEFSEAFATSICHVFLVVHRVSDFKQRAHMPEPCLMHMTEKIVPCEEQRTCVQFSEDRQRQALRMVDQAAATAPTGP